MFVLKDVNRVCRHFSSLGRSNALFEAEKNRQHSAIGRIEKIDVLYEGKLGPKRLVMNKSLSTPHHVAMHISEWLANQSALALINNEIPWDMHRPLEDTCTLTFLRFDDSDPYVVNKAFWKSCSFLLGAVISSAFSEQIKVLLHSFPSPQIISGSFVYDVALGLDKWSPSPNELRVLSSEMVKLANKSLPFERLSVSETIAKEIFSENPYKLSQIPNIASTTGGEIVLYRVGDHIDISKGPLVGNSSCLGRCTVAAVHQTKGEDDATLYRFQGVALPKGLMLNSFAYGILEKRARQLNRSSFWDQKAESIA